MDSNDTSDFMFATQTHVMSVELLNMLDFWVYGVYDQMDEMQVWFNDFLKATKIGDEFTVTAAQAQWIIAAVQKGIEGVECEDDDYRRTLEEVGLINETLINETFDDYANFLRTTENGDLDIFSIFGQFKED